MNSKKDEYHRFQQEGWQRAAAAYHSAWKDLTRPFALHLIEAAGVARGTRLLDLACGPGYASEIALKSGAVPTGVDFSSEMIRIAEKRLPGIRFYEGNAQAMAFEDHYFDAVVMNFGLPHMSDPGSVFPEVKRVLKSKGVFGFTVWAGPDMNPGSGIVHHAVRTHADLDLGLPEGPDYFIFGNPEKCRDTLDKAGFDPASFIFRSVTTQWEVSSPAVLFESELNGGVRTAAVLRAQKPETLMAIKKEIETSVRSFKKGTGFAIPFTAHVITVNSV
jgi:SAM-dependent methyltransferase